jgi:hypothetical protein
LSGGKSPISGCFNEKPDGAISPSRFAIRLLKESRRKLPTTTEIWQSTIMLSFINLLTGARRAVISRFQRVMAR